MRDTNAEMVRLISAIQPIPGTYACQAEIIVADEFIKVSFGISQNDYVLVKKILAAQPFQPINAGNYLYFFVLSWRNNPDTGNISTAIRIEQNSQHKQFWFDISKELLANVAWLNRIESADEVAHLRLLN